MSTLLTSRNLAKSFQLWPCLLPLLLLDGTAMRAQRPTGVVEVHAHRYTFTPNEIAVKKDQVVTLKLISDDVPHSLVVQGLGINQTITKTHPVEVRITPKETGDFHGTCGRFCGSGHGSMTFIIHVEE